MTAAAQPIEVVWKRPKLYRKQYQAIYAKERYSLIEATTKCFRAGTLVATSRGHVPIDAIKIGDMILTIEDGKAVFRPCLKLYRNSGSHAMIRCITKHGIIEATQDHAFRTDTGWSPIIDIARRAMENRRISGGKVLRQHERTDRVIELSWAAGKMWRAASGDGCQWVHADSALSVRKVSDYKSSSGHRSRISWPYTARENGTSQEFRPGGQQARKSGIPFAFGEHTGILSRGQVWELNREHQRQFQIDRSSDQENQIRVCPDEGHATTAREKIRCLQNDHPACFEGRLLETCLISESDIIEFELFDSTETLYDIHVYQSNNYCITKSNINVHNSGKTVGCMAWLFEQALFGQAGWQFWWVAPTLKQARIAFRRYCFGIRRALPDGPTGPLFLANRSDLTITLFNGAMMCFLSGDQPDNLYGEDVRAAVMDEASRAREEAFHALRSTLTATRGPVRIIGNVKGRKNWFYRMCRKAEAQADRQDRTMHYSKITADDAVRAGVLDAAEINDARDALPEAVFRELYYAEPTDDEGNPFGFAAIRAGIVASLSSKKPVSWGIDLAKKRDYTVLIALDEDGQACRFERFQKSWEDTIAHIKRTCKGRAQVDSTGVGDPVLEALQKGGGGNFRGFNFTARSKQQLMEGLAVAIQSRKIAYPDGPIVSELECFEYEYTRTGVKYSAPVGMHDDCVMALALAVHGMRWRIAPIREEDVQVVHSIVHSEQSDYPSLSDDEF